MINSFIQIKVLLLVSQKIIKSFEREATLSETSSLKIKSALLFFQTVIAESDKPFKGTTSFEIEFTEDNICLSNSILFKPLSCIFYIHVLFFYFL